MSSGMEALGDAMTAAVVAKAVDPAHGAHGEADSAKCLNCGTMLVGHYCHACGQNGHLHRSLTGFGHDLVHGVFHFEGKFWETLPLILFQPGRLTRRYIHGERAKFVSPIAMFLFCIFLMFAVVGGLAGTMHTPTMNEADARRSLGDIRESLAKNDAQETALKQQIKADDRAGKDTEALERRLDQLQEETEGLKAAQHLVSGGKEGEADGLIFNWKTGVKDLDHAIAAVNKNPDLFLYQLQTKAYKYSWLLIPISTPMVWLLFFWKREYKLYDHLVFVTFSLIFMSLLVTLATVMGWIGVGAGWITLMFFVIPPLHMYRQLRGAYLCSRVGAVLRTWALMIFAFTALLLFAVGLLAMGLMH